MKTCNCNRLKVLNFEFHKIHSFSGIQNATLSGKHALDVKCRWYSQKIKWTMNATNRVLCSTEI